MLVFLHLMTETLTQFDSTAALAKISAALGAVGSANDNLAAIEKMRARVARLRATCADPNVSDAEADAAGAALLSATDELKLAELSIERRKGAIDAALHGAYNASRAALSGIERVAAGLDAEATATARELAEKLIAPAILQSDFRDKAINAVIEKMAPVWLARDVIARCNAQIEFASHAFHGREVCNRFDADAAAIAAGIASMRAAIAAA
jgi:hypothetical protein